MILSDNWDDFLARHNISDPEFSTDYASLYPGTNAFILERNNSYGMLIGQINREYNDFETPYGFGSYISNNFSELFTSLFFSQFVDKCRELNLIAGIIRFNPLMREPRHNSIDKSFIRNTAYIDSSGHFRDMYTAKCRYMLRRAEKLNVLFESARNRDDYIRFAELYRGHMKHIDAHDELLFDDDYFNKLLGFDFSRLFLMKDRDAVMGGALFLSGKASNSYYHLQAVRNRPDYPGAGNMLVHMGIEDAFSRGCKTVFLGGGTSSSPDDPLLKFKLSFTGQITSFNLGKIIIDKSEYDRRIRAIKTDNQFSDYFLAYRYNKE